MNWMLMTVHCTTNHISQSFFYGSDFSFALHKVYRFFLVDAYLTTKPEKKESWILIVYEIVDSKKGGLKSATWILYFMDNDCEIRAFHI